MDRFRATGYKLQRIHFVPARNPDAHSINPAELGFICLNEPLEVPDGEMRRGTSSAQARQRKKELFRMEDVPMQWSQPRRAGAGLVNLGNTCFMNSVLQCLLHTPPLAELLLTGRSLLATSAASSGGLDPISMTRQLLTDSLANKRNYVSPQNHARALKRVNRSFRLGRQEDAHEYLIALLDAMHERSIAGMNPKPPPELEFTSFIYRIFGGRTRSQVKCTECTYESNTYEPFLNLSLEITHASSVEKALAHFCKPETLDGANKYKCPKQKKGVRAHKRLTVEEAPPVLVVQLKRFEFSRAGRKISKPVAFGDELDLSPFMSKQPATPAKYDLYGVLVHQGHSMHSGHYFCFVKGSSSGEWLKFDDTRVHATSERNVLSQLPYILFYIKRQPGRGPGIAVAPPAKKQQPQQAKEQPAVREKAREVPLPPAAELAAAAAKRKWEVAAAATRRKWEAVQAEAVVEKGSKQEKKARRSLDPALADVEEAGQWVKQQPQQESSPEAEEEAPMKKKARLARHCASPIIGTRSSRWMKTHVKANGVGLAFSPRKLRSTAAVERPVRQPSRLQRSSVAAPEATAAEDDEKEEQQEQRRRPAKRKMAAIEEEESDSGKSTISAVSAPDWPPAKPAAAAAAAMAATSGRRNTDAGTVQQVLRSGGKATMGLQTWDDVEVADKRQHDRLLMRAVPARPKLDEYDEEYDRGKQKKVRGKERAGDRLGSDAFDKTFKDKQSGKLEVELQLKGNKRRRAEKAAAQHGTGQRKQGRRR